MTDPQKQTPPPEDAGGLDKIGQHGRVEFRMVTDDQTISPEIRQQIIEDLKAYRDDHSAHFGQPLAWGRLAELVGVSQGTLVDVVKGKYKGDTDAVLKKIDQFLADDRARAGRFDFRTHARIGITDAIFGVIKCGIRLNTMPVIVGSQGMGKSVHARAFAADRGGVIIIRPEQSHRDDRGVTKLLCAAMPGLQQYTNLPHPRRADEIKGWLRKHLSTVIIVDESQKLTADGLEQLRDFHDVSDPAGRRNVPIVFLGDQKFRRLLFASRGEQKSPISPQTARRMRPVLDLDVDCQVEGGGQFTLDDVLKIVRNNRVKLLTPRAARWLRDLANADGWGKIGFAMGVLQLAIDELVPPGGELAQPVDVADLDRALEMTFGKSVAIEIAEAAGGELLIKAAG